MEASQPAIPSHRPLPRNNKVFILEIPSAARKSLATYGRPHMSLKSRFIWDRSPTRLIG